MPHSGKPKELMKKFGIDALVISGGDDTGSVVVDLGNQGIQNRWS